MIDRYRPRTVTRSVAPFGRPHNRRRRPHLPRHGRRAPETLLSVTLPRATWTVPLARRLTHHLLRQASIDAELATAVEMAVGEACSNAVRHTAPASHYGLRLRLLDASCLVEVTDTGPGFHPRHNPHMPGPRALSGRGLPLIARVTDQLEIHRREPAGTLVRFVKDLRRPGGAAAA